jgi:hypothetical protein
MFQRTNGWIGADAVYSLTLSTNRTLWFFGDTFIGDIANGRRTNATMVNNTVAIQTGCGASMRINFFLPRNAAGRPRAWVEPPDARGWFWPFGSVTNSAGAWVFLWQMEKAGSGAFGFQNVAVWLSHIENPFASPESWKISHRKIPFTDLNAEPRRLFGSSALAADGWIYIYGVAEPKNHFFTGRSMTVARVRADAVEDFSQWRFWTGESWSENFRDATGIAGGMGAEFSVAFAPWLRRYIAVTTENGLSSKITARTAPNPWGPWSAPRAIHTCPEPSMKKGIFFYAGKAHVSLSADGEMLVSHAFNANDFWEIVRDARIYWPRFVRVPMRWE